MSIFGLLRVRWMKSRRDLRGLVRALSSRNRRIRVKAAEALIELGDRDAIRHIWGDVITSLTASRESKQAAIPVLERFGDVHSLIFLLERGGVGYEVEEALVRIGAPAIERLLQARRFDNCYHAYDLVIQVGSRGVKALISLLNKNKVARWAARALGDIGDVRAVEPLIAALRVEPYLLPEEYVADVAAWALGKIGDSRAVEPLIAVLEGREGGIPESAYILRNGGSQVVDLVEPRIAAIEALGSIGGSHAVDALITALERGTKGTRSAAIKALGKMGDLRAVQPLIALLKDRDKDIRKLAIEALGELGDSSAIEPLSARLRDRAGEVRQAAQVALSRFGVSGDSCLSHLPQ